VLIRPAKLWIDRNHRPKSKTRWNLRFSGS